MRVGDVDAVVSVIDAANAAHSEAGLRPPSSERSRSETEAIRQAHVRFVERDGPGAWVAVADGQVVGVAESIRREAFWGLSMLFVHPGHQSRGIGRQLLDAAIGYGADASGRMIESTADPRAMRCYFLAGLAMHPAAEVGGDVDRRSVPGSLPGRAGGVEDLDLVASVEAHVGRSRTEDVAFVLGDARYRLDVVDHDPGLGWVLWAPDRLIMLGATDDQTAAALLWRYLDQCQGPARVTGLTAAQQWAFAVAHAARLSVRMSGALFVGGMAVPRSWIPSGWFF